MVLAVVRDTEGIWIVVPVDLEYLTRGVSLGTAPLDARSDIVEELRTTAKYANARDKLARRC
jgi:hypothetical protein